MLFNADKGLRISDFLQTLAGTGLFANFVSRRCLPGPARRASPDCEPRFARVDVRIRHKITQIVAAGEPQHRNPDTSDRKSQLRPRLVPPNVSVPEIFAVCLCKIFGSQGEPVQAGYFSR